MSRKMPSNFFDARQRPSLSSQRLNVSCGGSSSETSNDASELANSSEIGELVIDEDAAGAPSGDGTLSIPSTSESLDVSSDLDSEEEDTATADE